MRRAVPSNCLRRLPSITEARSTGTEGPCLQSFLVQYAHANTVFMHARWSSISGAYGVSVHRSIRCGLHATRIVNIVSKCHFIRSLRVLPARTQLRQTTEPASERQTVTNWGLTNYSLVTWGHWHSPSPSPFISFKKQ